MIVGEEGVGKGALQALPPEAEDSQLFFCAGHADVEEAALLLIQFHLFRVRVGASGRVDRGQDAVGHVHQDHPLVFQALAGVDGGDEEGAFRVAGPLGHDALQFPQAGQEHLGAVGLFSQALQNV